MSQYDNVNFPAFKLIHDMQRSVSIPVSIITNGNIEYRITKQAQPRYTWIFPTRTLTNDDKVTLLTFYLARFGALRSFNFTDPDSGTVYHVRFDTDLSWALSALNTDNSPLLHNIGDVKLIQVFE
jgi:hypothetical protein